MTSDATDPGSDALWYPPADRVRRSRMRSFISTAAAHGGRELADTAALHRWSVERPEEFWRLALGELLPAVDNSGPVWERGAHMADVRWFPEVRMNVAEQILAAGPPDGLLAVAVDERFVLGDEGDWSQLLVETSKDVVMSITALPAEIRKFLRAAHAGELQLKFKNIEIQAQLMYRLGHQVIVLWGTATAMVGESFKKLLSLSSASTTIHSPAPSRALVP